jgi:tetratricopeptide (TPR) repeat protein
MRLRFFSHALLCVLLLFLFSAQAASAKDQWINVRSKNFNLIGNAGDKEMRVVATKLEQFRETFRVVFARMKLTSPIQTNVIVFKNDASYRPFKPKRADGKPDDGIAGYFQAGEDVNYITLSVEGNVEDSLGTVFHEYVHFLLDTNFGRSEVPAWFNEGLAEYYQTFKIEKDQKAILGTIQENHLGLLAQNQLIPLKTFFEIDNYSLHQNGNHSRSIFYAQAWALIHYLIQSNKGANADSLGKFLDLLLRDVEPETAFQQAFQMDYATMETALRKYVGQRSFTATALTFNTRLVFETDMTTLPLAEAESNAYLGDLLYHTREYTDAENYLANALALDPNSSLANTSLGLVKMRQRKFDEAKKYLEKAVAADGKNHFAHYNYAYILSRESMDEFGYVKSYPAETAKKMRASLQKAIEIKPDFTESYRLLGFINLVSNENLDESLAYLKKGLALQPGNQEYALLMAQIYLKQEKFAEVKVIAEKLAKTAPEQNLRSSAEKLLSVVNQIEEAKAMYEKRDKEMEEKGIRKPTIIKKSSLSEAERVKIEQENEINNLNRTLEKPKAGEQRAVGYIEKITCAGGMVNYTVKGENEIFALTSKDFNSLNLIAMIEGAENLQVGCDAKLNDLLAVVTFQPNTNAKLKSKGTLLTIIFVPKYFKLKTGEELAKAPIVYLVDEDPQQEAAQNPRNEAEMEKARREGILRSIREALRKPQEGEKQAIGYVEKIECSGQNVYFHIKTDTETLKLVANPKNVKFASYTRDMEQMQMGCGVKMPEVPAVITYRTNEFRLKDTAKGELLAVEFVPQGFKLE